MGLCCPRAGHTVVRIGMLTGSGCRQKVQLAQAIMSASRATLGDVRDSLCAIREEASIPTDPCDSPNHAHGARGFRMRLAQRGMLGRPNKRMQLTKPAQAMELRS
jgi:hypothetical protein